VLGERSAGRRRWRRLFPDRIDRGQRRLQRRELGLACFELLERELELRDALIELLARATEALPLQLRELDLELLDLDLAREQRDAGNVERGALCDDELPSSRRRSATPLCAACRSVYCVFARA